MVFGWMRLSGYLRIRTRDDKPNGSLATSNTFAYETLDHMNSEHGPMLFDYLQEIADVGEKSPWKTNDC